MYVSVTDEALLRSSAATLWAGVETCVLIFLEGGSDVGDWG